MACQPDTNGIFPEQLTPSTLQNDVWISTKWDNPVIYSIYTLDRTKWAARGPLFADAQATTPLLDRDSWQYHHFDLTLSAKTTGTKAVTTQQLDTWPSPGSTE